MYLFVDVCSETSFVRLHFFLLTSVQRNRFISVCRFFTSRRTAFKEPVGKENVGHKARKDTENISLCENWESHA